MKQDTCLLLHKSTLLLLVALLFSPLSSAAAARVPDKGYSKSLEVFRQVVCEDDELFLYNRGLIRGLSYTNTLALRSFARLPGISPEELVQTLKRLVRAEISFDNQLLLARFVTLEGADVAMSW